MIIELTELHSGKLVSINWTHVWKHQDDTLNGGVVYFTHDLREKFYSKENKKEIDSKLRLESIR